MAFSVIEADYLVFSIQSLECQCEPRSHVQRATGEFFRYHPEVRAIVGLPRDCAQQGGVQGTGGISTVFGTLAEVFVYCEEQLRE